MTTEQLKAQRNSILIMLFSTLIGATAQVLFKKSGALLPSPPTLVDMITCLPLLGGYCLLGIQTLLLSVALKNAELSVLYPIIALSYVWVMLASVMIFHETLNPYKIVGVVVIVIGVTVLGRGSQN